MFLEVRCILLHSDRFLTKQTLALIHYQCWWFMPEIWWWPLSCSPPCHPTICHLASRLQISHRLSQLRLCSPRCPSHRGQRWTNWSAQLDLQQEVTLKLIDSHYYSFMIVIFFVYEDNLYSFMISLASRYTWCDHVGIANMLHCMTIWYCISIQYDTIISSYLEIVLLVDVPEGQASTVCVYSAESWWVIVWSQLTRGSMPGNYKKVWDLQYELLSSELTSIPKVRLSSEVWWFFGAMCKRVVYPDWLYSLYQVCQVGRADCSTPTCACFQFSSKRCARLSLMRCWSWGCDPGNMKPKDL